MREPGAEARRGAGFGLARRAAVAGGVVLAAACSAPDGPPPEVSCVLSVAEVVDSHIPTFTFRTDVIGAAGRAATFNFGDGDEERVTRQPFVSRPHSFIAQSGEFVVSSEAEVRVDGSPETKIIACEQRQRVVIVPPAAPEILPDDGTVDM